MIRFSIFILVIFFLTSCGNSRVIITSQNQRVEIKFIDNPKRLRAGTIYYLKIIDNENPKSPLFPIVNNGMITRQSTPNQPPFLYTLKPFKAGTLILKITTNDKNGEVILIDTITIENK